MGAIMYMDKQYGGGGSVPVIDGSTVTPTDNIQTWLKCAELDEAYTTLSAVLADDDVMEKLFRSENASDYLVRSTTWASDITADQTAMILIGKNDYCADKLLSNSTWSTAICDNGYLDVLLNFSIPKMTSNSQDGFTASASSTDGSTYAYKAFIQDGNADNRWNASDGSKNNSWLQIEFPYAVQINKISINLDGRKTASTGWRTLIFTLQGSNDGSIFTDISTNLEVPFILNTSYNMVETIYNNIKYKYYRIVPTQYNVTVSNGWMALWDVNLYGRAAKTTIYSAANDIVSFIDDEGAKVVKTDATGKGEVSIVCKPNTDIMFTSSVAKDTSDPNKYYSKVITVGNNSKSISVMPDTAIYWFGNECIHLTGHGFTPYSYAGATATKKVNSLNTYISPTGASNTEAWYTSDHVFSPNQYSYLNGYYTASGTFGTGGRTIAAIRKASDGSALKYEAISSAATTLTKQSISLEGITESYKLYTSYVWSKDIDLDIFALWFDSPNDDSKAEISAIGTNEDKPTASRAYAVNDLFYYNGKIGKVIQPIAAGAQFTLNTNYIETTICELITSLLNA